MLGRVASRKFYSRLAVKSISNNSFRSSCAVRYMSHVPTSENDKKDDVPKKSVSSVVRSSLKSVVEIVSNPAETWKSIKEVADHYWLGSKLLWAEIKSAAEIVNRIKSGHEMTRRERMHLLRTASDIFRLVPFSIFVIVPFMEFLLPIALKLFPNMLPSTFQDKLKKEEDMKRELQMRLAVVDFLHETLQSMASKHSQTPSLEISKESGATKVVEFLEKLKVGESLPNERVIEIASLFKDELTLPNIGRPQLESLCKYMCISTYGSDSFLRFQLRNKMKQIKEDDKRILWEGVDSLTVLELRDACRERGMRAHGLNNVRYQKQLRDWLDLSIQKNVPIALLIMSRAFMLASPTSLSEDILKSSISALDKDTINEVVLSVASSSEEETSDIRLRKLESIQFQQEMIHDELEENEEVRRSKLSQSLVESREIEESNLSPSATDAIKVSQPLKVDSEESGVEESSVVVNRTLAPGHRGASEEDDASLSVSPSAPAVAESVAGQTTVSADSDHTSSDAGFDLSVYEVQAIGDLTRESSVEREKATLTLIQSQLEAVEMKTSKDHNIKQSSAHAVTDAPASDRSMTNMHTVLNWMLKRLENQIDSTEKAVGDKLHVLDLDKDGQLTTEELKVGVMKILKRSEVSDEDIQELIRILDTDKDGKVSVVELIKYAEALRERKEAEQLESRPK